MTLTSPVRHALAAAGVGVAALATLAVLVGTAAPGGSSGPAMQSVAATSSTTAAGGGGSGGGGGGGGHAIRLPADFPTAAVPLPAGTLTAVGGRAPRWSVLLVVPGPADRVQRQSVAFYKARGWVQKGPNSLRKGAYTVALAAAARDHSAAKSNLTIVVARA